MKNIFEGLEKFGFSKKDIDPATVLSGNMEPKSAAVVSAQAAKTFNISDFIFQKPFECPICDKNFTSPALKAGKVRLSSVDYDLRPIYEQIEPMFYDIIMCNHCGYAVISQKFGLLSDTISNNVHTFLKSGFTPMSTVESIDINTAIDRYKMALLCATKRGAKDGERAFICMKLTWLYRILGDRENELSCMALTLKGYKTAYSTESMPICGLNNTTIMFIMAAYSKVLGLYDESMKYLSSLIVDRGSSSNIKERAKDLRDEILKIQADKKN